MGINSEYYKKIVAELKIKNVTLVAVSKTKSVEEILELYNLGQRDFGENYVQELVEKYEKLPKDICWHFIGHLQTNKVKLIAPFVSLVQSVDSEKLLKEINKEAKKNNRIIDCLLQVHIAKEETKFGLDKYELEKLLSKDDTDYKNISIKGLMGMASFTDDTEIVRVEFKSLKYLFDKPATFTAPVTVQTGIHHSPRPLPLGQAFTILSMGMSADYKIAIEEGSNMVRLGSLLFGKRD
ncbi:MAG TPA: YggS family pyridoxal phosphate-dependent enzyme [Hanamia sp.]